MNWHRDNIVSLITQFAIEGIVVKKTESNAFGGRIKKSGIFKLYLEGVILSLAGSIGKFNKHYYKIDIQTKLQNPDIFGLSIAQICTAYNLTNCFDGIPSVELEATKDALFAVIALKSSLTK